MKSISVVIPNYNGEEILQQNLPIIIKHVQKYSAPIIIVDDKSTDNSVQVLKQHFPQIKLIEKPYNEGFSSTVNIGLKNANTELVCLLNSDIVTTENFLDPIFSYFDKSDVAAVGMKDLSDDNDSHGRGRFFLHKGFLLHQKYQQPGRAIESGETGWVSCGSGVFSKKIWEKLGGLDELLNPFYFEDVDLGYRYWKSGYKMYFEENAIVKHIHQKGAIKSNYQENKIKKISYQNQIAVSATNLTDKEIFTGFLLHLPINTLIALKNKDKPFLEALITIISRTPRLVKSRNNKKRFFKKKDKEILEIFV